MVIVWLVLGVVCLLAESHHRQFYLVFAALGAFVAAIIAGIVPGLIPVQAGVGVAVVAGGIGLLRPQVMRRVSHRNTGKRPGRGVQGTLVGEEVLTLDIVGDAHEPGHVRLAGERWLAVSTFATPIPAGTRALVVGVRGTTLQVSPLAGDEILELP